MDVRRVFGLNMRRRRLHVGVSQEVLAERMGVDRAFVSSMERGLANVTLETLWLAAQGLGVSCAELLDESVSDAEYDPKAKSPRRGRTPPPGR